MRAFALAAASLLTSASPQRVASINLCTDELLLLLGDPRQIASVTYLSQSPSESPLWRQARPFKTNDGSLLNVVGTKPDLILTMGGGARDRAALAGRLDIPILTLPYPQSLSDIRMSIAKVGAALGRPAAARAFETRLDDLERSKPGQLRDTIWLGGGGRTVAATGLAADWMRLAGLKQRPFVGDRVTLEQLLVAPPALLLRSNYRQGQFSGEQRWLAHPLASNVHAKLTLATDGRAWTCMGPTLIPEIQRLRQEIAR